MHDLLLENITSFEETVSRELNHSLNLLNSKVTTLNESSAENLLSVNSLLEEKITILDITSEAKLRNVSLKLERNLVEIVSLNVSLAESIRALVQLSEKRFGNVSAELEQSFMALVQSLQKLNFSCDEKSKELGNAIEALQSNSSTQFETLENRQERNFSMMTTQLASLNASIAMLFQTIAMNADIDQLNSSFNHQLQQQIQNLQSVLLGQLNETRRVSASNYQSLNQSFSMLQESLNVPGLLRLLPASSCAALPSSVPSGYYWVKASNGSGVRVYCDKTRSCGGITGGWIRVADLDMTNSSHQCPSSLRQHTDTDSSKRTCVKKGDTSGCSAVRYSVSNIQYSRVCGKVIGYQVGTTNAFFPYSHNNADISSVYVDGVSLTYSSPKKHIWTFVAALGENNVAASSNCLCINDGAVSPPSYIGTDYFCDTGLPIYDPSASPGFLSEDPLWDGEGCGPPSNCCTFENPPWFHKQLSQPTSDDIEMRVCRDSNVDNEDIAIESVELFIQ